MCHAAIARCPASPRTACSNPSAVCSCSELTGGAGWPYHSAITSAVQARVRSRWHKLQAFSRPVSTVDDTDGESTSWLRACFNNPYVVCGI